MFDPDKLPVIQERIREETDRSAPAFEELRAEVDALRLAGVTTIQPTNTNMISLVASDAGNNRLEFNPLMLQVVRVVDSYGAEQFFDVISSWTDAGDLSRRQFGPSGEPATPLGLLMQDLGASTLSELSPMIPERPRTPGWTLVYRDLCEWAVIYDLCHKEFASDTVILHDGLLRTKIFAGDLFVQMYKLIKKAIDRTRIERRRDLFVVGIAKHSEVLERYALAMAISEVFPDGASQYAPIPMEMQKRVYKWAEYLRLPSDNASDVEQPKFNMGEMYFVRFGPRSGDPVWTVDLLHGQTDRAQKIFGSLLNDAQLGFPIAYYPHSLQQADAHAQIVDLDLAILQDTMVEAVRAHVLPARRPLFDAHRLVISDPAARRYS
jgi:hypothetical protein